MRSGKAVLDGWLRCDEVRQDAVWQGGLGRVCSGPFRGVCQGMAV